MSYQMPEVGVATAASRCLTNACAVHGSARDPEEYLSLAPQCLSTVRHYLTEATEKETTAMYASVAALIDRILL